MVNKCVNTVPVRWKFLKNKKVLMTNDFGYYVILKEKDFRLYINDKINKNNKKYKELKEKGFIKTYLDFSNLLNRWKNSNSYLFKGPSLHILILTLRCNHSCLYCQSQATQPLAKNTDMSISIAKKAIDIAFSSTSNNINIEFQGGEPLYNWEVLKYAVNYIRTKEKKEKKEVFISLVTNLSLMSQEKLNFLLKNEISICTSLDGPKNLHDLNRTFKQTSSYKITTKWINYLNEKYEKQYGLPYRVFKPSALLTVSKYSLKYAKEIVDEYIKNNIGTIFIRPLSPIGFANKHWDKIGYSAEEFIEFYKKALVYILEKNENNENILVEKMAQILLNKIINGKDSDFTDLRSPCGAVIGQIAYNFDGDVYTCDEGRMLGWEGKKIFKIGTVNDKYEDLINSITAKSCAHISNLENQPRCSRCPYMPWCGVCPVINYETQNNVWGENFNSYRCSVMMGIFETIFELLENKRYKKLLYKWIK